MTHKYYLKILNEKEKNQILTELNKQFKISEMLGIITQRGKERLFLYTGDLDKDKLKELSENIPIERVGIYFAKDQDFGLRLSIEGVYVLKNQIKDNIFELENQEQVKQWMQGSELNISTGKIGFLVMKYKDDLFGCGKASENKITNFISKNRRLKIKEN
jgi:NOL1/NOP2/fmu family ribosome biogenesis protein